MSGTVPAEEIADDFRHSLEFLQTPDRYAINNFTVIAKENTEHADAISNVLVEHIRKAPPHHKLPALYVLDSIAKNIGTPYSLFLGHKLYGVFMGAYSSVDSSTRRKLDEMLKTWKAPVPGSIDPTPVFPPEITRKIENALIQAKTAALKHDHNQPQVVHPKRPTSALAATQWRNTPTPPSKTVHYPPPTTQPYYQQQGISPFFTQSTSMQPSVQQLHFQQHPNLPGAGPSTNFGALPHPVLGYDQPTTVKPNHVPMMQASPYPNAVVDMNALHRDLDLLISSCRLESQSNQTDSRVMSKLQALVALKDVLNTHSLPADQLVVVRRQVDDLQAAERRADTQSQIGSSTLKSTSHQLPLGYNRNSFIPSQPTSIARLGAFDTQADQTDLATLLAKASGEANRSGNSVIATDTPSSDRTEPGHANSGNFSFLLADLADKGLFGQVSSNQQLPPQFTTNTSTVGQSVAELIARASGLASTTKTDIQLTSVSLKIPRPSLFKLMLERLPNQCVNCGLRFPSSEDGRRKKDQHMDWHFRANQRIADSSRGIQSRSRFVGELEWIQLRDGEEQSDPNTGEQVAGNGNSNSVASAPKYVPVPGDPDAHQPCPICQEPFDTGFNQDIQDWVWLDAVRVGAKIFHASCFADLKRDGLESRDKTSTPDSVLGKRKAESGNDVTPAKKPFSG